MADKNLLPDGPRVYIGDVDVTKQVHVSYSKEFLKAMQAQARLDAGLPPWPVPLPAAVPLAAPVRKKWWQRLLGR
jgi:hypothetical protein